MGQKISGLANEMLASEVASDDLIYIVDVSEPTSSNTRSNKMQWSELKLGITSLYDINNSNYLSLNWLEDDTVDRILNIKVNGASRELDLQNDIALNQSLLTTSDVVFNSVTISGDLNHDGSNLGFYSVAPVSQQVAPLAGLSESNTDATDLATALTLVNSLKSNYNDLVGKYNSLRTNIINTGLMS